MYGRSVLSLAAEATWIELENSPRDVVDEKDIMVVYAHGKGSCSWRKEYERLMRDLYFEACLLKMILFTACPKVFQNYHSLSIWLMV